MIELTEQQAQALEDPEGVPPRVLDPRTKETFVLLRVVDARTLEGKATGLLVNSVISSLVLVTVYADTVAQVLGSLSPSLPQKFDDCLKTGLQLP